MEQTAVEWLISEIKRHNDSGYEFRPKYNEEIIERALEMERQQIIDAHWEASEDTDIAEEYYNRKFK